MYTEGRVVFEIPSYVVRLLDDGDLPDLQALLEMASDYSILVDGKPPSSQAAHRLLTEVPPGKSLDDKLVLGIFDGHQLLVGVLDVIRNYPEPATWWVGLLLLHPEKRNLGLGAAIVQSFESWAMQSGAREIGLGVVEKNVRAVRFWEKLGFVTQEKKLQTIDSIQHLVYRMRRRIA